MPLDASFGLETETIEYDVGRKAGGGDLGGRDRSLRAARRVWLKFEMLGSMRAGLSTPHRPRPTTKPGKRNTGGTNHTPLRSEPSR
jgi:hypothetical protein